MAPRVHALRHNRTPARTQQAPVGSRRACSALPGRKWHVPSARQFRIRFVRELRCGSFQEGYVSASAVLHCKLRTLAPGDVNPTPLASSFSAQVADGRSVLRPSQATSYWANVICNGGAGQYHFRSPAKTNRRTSCATEISKQRIYSFSQIQKQGNGVLESGHRHLSGELQP